VFDIDADQVDADRWFLGVPPAAATGKSAPAAPAAAPPGAKAEDAKADLSGLRSFNGSGNLRIARLRVKGTDVADVRAAIKANDGRLDVAPFSLRVHGGSVNGRLGADAGANRVAANGSLAGIQLRRLAGTIGGRAAIEGSAGGTFDLAAAGATVNQMKRSLAGTVALDVRDGALVGIDLADLIGTAAGFLQSKGRQTGTLDENKRTPFSQLSASVRIKDGVATNDDLKAKSPQFDITGGGRMDVVSTELDYTLRAQVLPGAATEAGPLRSVAGITVPVRISGPVEHPGYVVDWAPIAGELLLKRATGRSRSPSVNQVIEGLGDLLRRKK
jgi:AsmA protein